MRYRIEKDALGEKTIPQEAYYGVGTERSKGAFQITKHGLSRQMIKALATVKKVSAKTNGKMGLLNEKESEAICLSCDEILNGRLHGQFVVDVLHDGYGYGMDINANEVVCNRANEMLGGKKGMYSPVSLEKMTIFQDINEVTVLTGKLTAVKLTKKLVAECKKTYNVIYDKVKKSEADQDSFVYRQLMSFGEILERDTKRIDKAIPSLLQISYGKKVDLQDNKKEEYLQTFISYLNKEVTEKYVLSENKFNVSHNLDAFMYLSALVKDLMVNFSRSMSNFISLINDGSVTIEDEICVNASDSKLLYGFVRQVSFYIVGNDMTISRSVEEGTLDDNPYMSIIYASLYESINLVRRAIRTIKEKAFEIMTINNKTK